MSSSLEVKAYGDCSDKTWDKVHKVLSDKLSECMRVLDPITSTPDVPLIAYKLQPSFEWIRVDGKDGDHDKIARISYRINCQLLLQKDGEWKSAHGYAESYQMPVDESDRDLDGIANGLVYVLEKIHDLIEPNKERGQP